MVEIRNGDPGESPVVGWLPEEACSNVMAEFCPSALFFCSLPPLEAWRRERAATSGEALDMRSLAQRGREEWAQVVGSASR
jgi:alkylmercury lyase